MKLYSNKHRKNASASIEVCDFYSNKHRKNASASIEVCDFYSNKHRKNASASRQLSNGWQRINSGVIRHGQINRVQGFSLMELLIVIVIIGVLMGVAVVNLQDTPNQARISAAQQEIRTISTALDMYSMHNARYPSSDSGLKALVEKPAEAKRWPKGGYLKSKKPPLDPWDNPYRYLYPGNNGEFDVYSLGPDGRESDDDIGNWMLE